MHAMGDVIDMRKFSGLRKVLPITHWTFLCGAGALAGVPFLFSGFWSKDEILSVCFLASHEQSAAGKVYLVLFASGMLTAGLTAFYTARAYFLTFWGEVKIPPEAGHHAHESPQRHDGAAHDPGRGGRVRRRRAGADRDLRRVPEATLARRHPRGAPCCRSSKATNMARSTWS